MKATRRAHKRAWAIEEWEAFAARCRSLRDRSLEFVRTFPDTRGFKVAHFEALFDVYRKTVAAMIGAESVIESQHPEAIGSVMRLLHEPSTATSDSPGRRGKDRSAPVLPRERWVELGGQFKAIADEFWDLGCLIHGTRDGQCCYRRFAAVDRAIRKVRCRLDDLVCGQHPDWPDATHVFYGQEEPRR